MDDFPTLPDSFYAPMAIVFEGHELSAITDAILIHDLAADGCLADVIALMDSTDDGGYNEGILLTLQGVRDKIDKANEPRRREMKKWLAEMDERREIDS